jgi:hypothetical protein
VIIFVLHIPRESGKGRTFLSRVRELDLLGASILIPAVICLLLALQWGGSTYPWRNSRIIGLFVGFGCLIVIFMFTQFRLGDRATLPPRILSQRTVIAAVCFCTMFGASFFLLVFYLPLYFQSIKGVSATKSGIDILPLMLAAVISSMVGGALVTWLGYYTPFIIAGSIIFTIGAGLITTYSINMSFGKWFAYQILTGAGLGVGFQIPLIAVQTVLPLADIPVASALIIFFQTLGGALFISVAQTVFQNGLIRGARQFAPNLDPLILLRAGATEIRTVLEKAGMLDELPGALKAYMQGLTDSYRVAVACTAAATVAALFFEWKSVKDDEVKRKKEAGGELGITM